jgi:hypothetical protein
MLISAFSHLFLPSDISLLAPEIIREVVETIRKKNINHSIREIFGN